MQTDNPFLLASRRQLRFTTTRGPIATEDLWQLSLKTLDAIAVAIASKLEGKATSFLTNPDTKATQAEEDEKLRLEILKQVIQVKEAENKAALEIASKRRQREFLQDLLAKKKLDAMEQKTMEEIEAELKALE